MITVHSITSILVFLACASALPVAKPTTLQSPDEVALKMVLRKTGKVTDITVLQASGCSYDREAIKAASKLKFDPALKDSQPVSQYAEVKYKTEMSGSWRNRVNQ
jgi:TonB family protein